MDGCSKTVITAVNALMQVFVQEGVMLIPIYLKIILHVQLLRAGEPIIYKIRTGHVSQNAIASVTWNRLPQLSGLSAKTVYKPTVKNLCVGSLHSRTKTGMMYGIWKL